MAPGNVLWPGIAALALLFAGGDAFSARQLSVSARAASPARAAGLVAAEPRTTLDPAARLVDGSAGVRKLVAFPVAFAASSNWLAQCIYVACELKVFDALSHGPRTVEELAAEVGADANALGRLLRALGGQGPVVGVVVEVFDPPFWPLPFAPPVPLPVPPLPGFLSGFLRPPLSSSSSFSDGGGGGGHLDSGSDVEGARRYALTPLGALLREDAVGSMRPWAMFSGRELGQAWGGLLTAVQTGKPDFVGAQQQQQQGSSGGGIDGENKGASSDSSSSDLDAPVAATSPARGTGFFEYMQANPSAGARFDASMAAVSAYALEAGSAAELFDWTRGGKVSTVVDVGGGTGTLLASILKRNPALQGTLFDQRQVLRGAPAVLEAAGPGVAARCTLVGGSFFEVADMPKGADVYAMKNIIHDWADADAVALLAVVSKAMAPGSALVLLDCVRSARVGHEPWALNFEDYFDLNMLVTVGGKERTEAEWRALVALAGLEVVGITPGPGVSAIETRLRAV